LSSYSPAGSFVVSFYSHLVQHRGMVFDDVRNSAYAAALGRVLTRDAVVLDLGSGLGLHGLMAAARGARHVYLVDPSPVVGIARKLAEANGLSDQVTCIQKSIELAELPEKVDLIISVLTGNFLVQEDLLPSLFYARDKYLKPGGVLLPDYAEMRIVPVSANKYHDKLIGQWSRKSQSISFEPARQYAANAIYFDDAVSREVTFLSKPQTVTGIDFHTATRADCSGEVVFTMQAKGVCHGYTGWFRMRLSDHWVSTSPAKPAMHWSQAFLPLDPPVMAEKQEQLTLTLKRPQFGDWTWASEHGGARQQHSTFLSGVLNPARLRLLSAEHRARLNDAGALAQFVLQRMTGINTIRDIFDAVEQSFGDRFASREELEKHVRSVLFQYGE
jgi:predicted RNA methylase